MMPVLWKKRLKEKYRDRPDILMGAEFDKQAGYPYGS